MRIASSRTALLIMSLFLLGPVAAQSADEPSGCDKFKWDIARERATLTAPGRIMLASGGELASAPPTGLTLALRSLAEAALPAAPERAPKDGSFAGYAKFAGLAKGGLYTVGLSSGAWVDVIQDGHLLTPKAFSGATDCDGIRKTMRYELSAAPFVLQVSGTPQTTIAIAILPQEPQE
jgi:hypothetical protein